MVKKRILIGEDEKNIQEMYRFALEQAGYEVYTADNGNDVIKQAKAARPDLVYLDINMPEKDGFELLKDISEQPQLYRLFDRIPIIVLSNYSNQQDIDYCLAKGAQDYLVKTDWTPKAIVDKTAGYLKDYGKR